MPIVLVDLDIGSLFPFKYCFNPTIIDIPNSEYLLICRLQNNDREGYLGLCYLDSQFKTTGRTCIIKKSPVIKSEVMLEDPRLFRDNNNIYLAHVESSAQLIYNSYTVLSEVSGELLQNSLVINYQKNLDALKAIEENSLAGKFIKLPVKDWKIEKNWQFFNQEDKHFAIYNANKKHEIIQYDNKTGAPISKFVTYYKNVWNHGRISGGGCPALFSDNYFYSFFHSWTTWETPVQKQNWEQRQYHIGVYVFESVPPFRIKKMSVKPLISGSNTDPISASGHSVVFPGSALFDPKSGKWILAVGWNDMDSKILFIDHEDVKSSLVDVSQINSTIARTSAIIKRTFTSGIKLINKIKNKICRAF